MNLFRITTMGSHKKRKQARISKDLGLQDDPEENLEDPGDENGCASCCGGFHHNCFIKI